MEAPKTTWTKKETLAAAEESPCLSALLKNEGLFKCDAVRWLEPEHVAKFFDATDASEARQLMDFSAGWYFSSDRIDTKGLPLLDKLNECSDGWRLVARLATLEPAWVTRWWKWKTNRSSVYGENRLTKVLVHALNTEEFRCHASELTDEVVAAIITQRPELLDVVPGERLGPILSLAVEGRGKIPDLAGVLSSHGLPSDAAAIIDGLLGSGQESNHLALLNELLTAWKGPPASDPVVRATTDGHERLDAILHSPWRVCGQPSGKERDDALWADGIQWNGLGRAIGTAACTIPTRFRLELGFSVGQRLAGSGLEPSAEAVRESIKSLGIEPTEALVDAVFPMAELWATLRKLAEFEASSWKHETELVGLRARVISLAEADPKLWAQALPWVFVRASALGHTTQAVTLELATISREVRSSLEIACDDKVESVRLIARGLRTLLQGLDDPKSGLARTLGDAAAHYMDGTPIFPHPLAPVSATWLGSTGVERAIASGVKRASDRFAAEVRDQGGDIEEALTKALVKEIEVEFRDVQPRLKRLGASGSRSPAPILSVRQRPASKTIEEPVYGCDIAWLLNGTVRGHFRATWVDLVQVKKSSALQHHRKTRFRADSWRINCKQLNNILKWSATAAYWLIASAGEVLVIPARHLEAVRRGTEKHIHSKTFTVGYHEVRSAAIPLEQYLVDLLIGQWVGTSSEEVIQFALGENSNIRPRVVVEVTISVGQDNQ